MAKKPEKDSEKDLQQEVWSAISAFEQILEAMPNDRASLEALSHAYEQIGEKEKAKEYLIRLGHVIREQGDDEAGQELLDRLETFADDAAVKDLIDEIRKTLPGKGVEDEAAEDRQLPAEAEPSRNTSEVRMTFNMADELSFAWTLLEKNELTQEEYASVVQDLTEMSASDVAATVSVLHALQARGFKGLEKIMGVVAKDRGTPIISLASFDIQADAISLLPMDFMVRRGALIFETVGKDVLAVVMNPYDDQLRKDVASLSGRKCHFYITMPSEFDQALDKISQIETESVPVPAGEAG